MEPQHEGQGALWYGTATLRTILTDLCGLGSEKGIHYFAPDRLRWEALDCSRLGLIEWALTGDLARFYASVRWPGWEQEVAALEPAKGISVYPFLWAAGAPIASRSDRRVRVGLLYAKERLLSPETAERAARQHRDYEYIAVTNGGDDCPEASHSIPSPGPRV